MFNASDVKELRDKTGAGMMDCKNALEETSGNMEEAITWLREKGISKAQKKESRIAAEGLTNVLVNDNNAVILEVNSETDFVAKNEEFKNFVNDLSETILSSDVTSMEDALNITIDNEKVSDKIVSITAKIGEKISFRRFVKLEKTSDDVFGSYIHMGGRIAVLVILKGSNQEIAKDVAMHACAMNPLYITAEDIPSEVLEKEKAIFKELSINEGKPEDIAEKMVAGRINKYYKEVCLVEQEFIKDSSLNVGTYVKNNGGTILKMVRFEVGEGIEKRVDNFAEEVANQIKG